MCSRLKLRPRELFPQVPIDGESARYAENVKDRSQRNSRSICTDPTPEAVDLTGAMLKKLHTAFDGYTPAISGDRDERYRRKQLCGERAIHLRDLAHMALVAPDGMVPFLHLLADVCGMRVVPRDLSKHRSVVEINGDGLRSFGEFEAHLIEALSDGILTNDEKDDVISRLHEVIDKFEELEPAIREAK